MRTLHAAIIPDTVRLPLALVHLSGHELDDLALLSWIHHPEKGWALGHDPTATMRINVRATLLARTTDQADFILGRAILTGSDTGELLDVDHDVITSLERFG